LKLLRLNDQPHLTSSRLYNRHLVLIESRTFDTTPALCLAGTKNCPWHKSQLRSSHLGATRESDTEADTGLVHCLAIHKRVRRPICLLARRPIRPRRRRARNGDGLRDLQCGLRGSRSPRRYSGEKRRCSHVLDRRHRFFEYSRGLRKSSNCPMGIPFAHKHRSSTAHV